jgi:hypothetical protein
MVANGRPLATGWSLCLPDTDADAGQGNAHGGTVNHRRRVISGIAVNDGRCGIIAAAASIAAMSTVVVTFTTTTVVVTLLRVR